MDFASLVVRLIQFSERLDCTFCFLESNKTDTKRRAATTLSEWNLNVGDFAILSKQLLKFLLRHCVRQIHHVQSLVIDKVILSRWCICGNFSIFFLNICFYLFGFLLFVFGIGGVHKAFKLIVPTLFFPVLGTQK